jgi:hypothetical protein
MQCIVTVRFLPGCSLPPSEFFARLNARWSWLETESPGIHGNITEKDSSSIHPRYAICIAEYDSIEQLSMDLAITPGAGVANIEITPLPGTAENQLSGIDGKYEKPTVRR